MIKKYFTGLILAMLLLFNNVVWANVDAQIKEINLGVSEQQRIDREYQIETVNKLLLGYYHGAWKVCEILNMGSIVADPKKVDRSMVVFNNKIYQLIEKKPLDDPKIQRTTALAKIYGIDKPIEIEQVDNIKSLYALNGRLETEISTHNDKNEPMFYVVQMSGEFSNLTLQNVPDVNWINEQMQGIKKTTKMRKYKNLKGTVTGIRMFDYLKSNKSMVWYFHFASDDKKISGIVGNMDTDKASLKISPVSDFSIHIPVWKD